MLAQEQARGEIHASHPFVLNLIGSPEHSVRFEHVRARVTTTLYAAKIVGMAGFATFPALLPTCLFEWSLSNTEAGWICGLYYSGYLVSVPFLTSLTDRVDSRRVLLGRFLSWASSSGVAGAPSSKISFRSLQELFAAPGPRKLVRLDTVIRWRKIEFREFRRSKSRAERAERRLLKRFGRRTKFSRTTAPLPQNLNLRSLPLRS